MDFPTTQWSLFAVVAAGSERDAVPALNELCRRYWGPVHSFFQSCMVSHEDAQDLTQGLFLQMQRNRAWLNVDVGRGRFRSYLMTAARNALLNWITAKKTARRGLGVTIESLDLLVDIGNEPAAPDDHAILGFDRDWAVSVVTAAWESLRAAFSAAEQGDRFDVLSRFLPGSESPPSYEDAAEMLDTSISNVRALVSRLRESCRIEVRHCVADTLVSARDLDEEMDYLHSILLSDAVTIPQIRPLKTRKTRRILRLFRRKRPAAT